MQYIFIKAKLFLDNNTYIVNSWDDFVNKISLGGFVYAHWDGKTKTEEKIKKITKATIRCIPLENSDSGKCVLTGNPSKKRVIFAKAY